MQFYYDLYLKFDDYYQNALFWDSKEHFNRLPIYRVLSIPFILDNEIILETEYKDIIVSDGISSIALEIYNNKVVYVSSLEYKDEESVNKIAREMTDILVVRSISKKENKQLSKLALKKKIFNNTIDSAKRDLIKYLYYELTGELSNDLRYMKKYLKDLLNKNNSYEYIELYDKIILGE